MAEVSSNTHGTADSGREADVQNDGTTAAAVGSTQRSEDAGSVGVIEDALNTSEHMIDDEIASTLGAVERPIVNTVERAAAGMHSGMSAVHVENNLQSSSADSEFA